VRRLSPAASRMKRVVLIDDDDLSRQRIRLSLGEIGELRVVADFGTARAGLEYCFREQPELLVSNLELPDLKGLDLMRSVRAALPETKVLLLAGGGRLPGELLTLGIEGYLDKACAEEFLPGAVRTVLEGGLFFASRDLPREKTKADARRSALPPLTAREQEIARRVAAGMSSKEIARDLGLSVRTVEKHRANLMAKIGVREVASLTRWCVRAGLLAG